MAQPLLLGLMFSWALLRFACKAVIPHYMVTAETEHKASQPDG